ncbi:hypothetical protein ACQY1M_23950 (plasmid) [Neorhizobium sp. DAR64861/K0K2]|uniref:hypothetical protein n=1 Tax=Neorhizobium sp. DAR64861/K0K2 TaxID=3421956 RepID=UPI003D2E92C3
MGPRPVKLAERSGALPRGHRSWQRGVRDQETARAAPPPEPLRRGNRYWRINAGPNEGYALVVSRDIPMCHITGGGGVDFQPAAEAMAASPDFSDRWERIGEERQDGMVSTLFRLRKEPKLALVLSRADAPGARRDRAQVIATATYDLGR